MFVVKLGSFAVGILPLLWPVFCFQSNTWTRFIANSVCGTNKILHSFETFSALENVLLSTCALHCSKINDCVSFNYIKASSDCQLNNGVMAETCTNAMKFPDGFYYEKEIMSQNCLHGGTWDSQNANCTCIQGYIGSRCDRIMNDCKEGLTYYGHENSADLLIHPSGAPSPFVIHCNMQYGGRNVIMTHIDPNISFNRTWTDYRDGFGVNGNFWIGLNKIYYLTKSRPMTVVIELRNPYTDDFLLTTFGRFEIADESDEYKIKNFVTSRFSEVPDCMPELVGASFSTFDTDNDENSSRNCASDYGAGWWFNTACAPCNPNGNLKIPPGGNSTGAEDEIFWDGIYWRPTVAKMWLV